MADGSTIKKKRFDGSEVEILGESYEDGQPSLGEKYNWLERLGDNEDDIKNFITTGLRYWHGEGFGSEKRKNPA